MLMHARHLDETCGVGPHTLSVPRLRPAADINLETFPHLVSDHDFRKIIAVLRMAVPYTGMIMSTRELPGFRDELFALGISQISAGSCTGVGGYAEQVHGCETCGTTAQFVVGDDRSPEELILGLCESGYIPSYCTACYRSDGPETDSCPWPKAADRNVCQLNAILTFKEYLKTMSPEVKEMGEKTITNHLALIKSDKVRAKTIERLQ